MKALIVSQEVSDGSMGWTRGQMTTVKRLVVPEANNLTITIDEANIYVFDNFNYNDPEENCTLEREIDIPEKLVARALLFMAAKNRLQKRFERIIG